MIIQISKENVHGYCKKSILVGKKGTKLERKFIFLEWGCWI